MLCSQVSRLLTFTVTLTTLIGAELLSKLTATEGEAKDHNDISSLEALKEVFMHYFITESAAERVVSNQVK